MTRLLTRMLALPFSLIMSRSHAGGLKPGRGACGTSPGRVLPPAGKLPLHSDLAPGG